MRVGPQRRLSTEELILWIVVLEKTLEGPLDCKEIRPVNPKGNQPWLFTGRTDAEAPICWPPDLKNWLIGKDPNAGKDGQEEKGVTGWDSWMASLTQWMWVRANRDSEGQESLACCSPWGCKESDTTEWLNKTKSPRLASPRNLFEMQILGSHSAAAKSLQ